MRVWLLTLLSGSWLLALLLLASALESRPDARLALDFALLLVAVTLLLLASALESWPDARLALDFALLLVALGLESWPDSCLALKFKYHLQTFLNVTFHVLVGYSEFHVYLSTSYSGHLESKK